MWVSTIAACSCLYRVQLVKVNSGQFGLSLGKVKWAWDFSFLSFSLTFSWQSRSCRHRQQLFLNLSPTIVFPELWSLFRFTFIARKWVKPSSGAPLVVKIGRVSSSLYSSFRTSLYNRRENLWSNKYYEGILHLDLSSSRKSAWKSWVNRVMYMRSSMSGM